MKILPFIRPALTIAVIGFFLLTGCFGANWLLALPIISHSTTFLAWLGLSVAFSKATVLGTSMIYGGTWLSYASSFVTTIKMKFFEGNQFEKAQKTWTNFNNKYQALTGDQSEFRDRQHRGITSDLEQIAQDAPQKHAELERAATTIGRWWKQRRSSGNFIRVNPQGNHSDKFHTLLNVDANGKIDDRIKKKLGYYSDQTLLADIQSGNWASERFRTPASHHNAFSLFASGKIDFYQKSTVSDVMETSTVFGAFKAYPILDKNNHFTKEAKQFLLPKLGQYPHGSTFTTRAFENFKNLVQVLPTSEQFFFIYENQKLINDISSPSGDHKSFRLQLETVYPYWLLNVEAKKRAPKNNRWKSKFNNFLINSYFSLEAELTNRSSIGINYSGILKLSFGARNAMGLAAHGNDWEPLIPRIGQQSIDDIEHFSKHYARPTISPESYHFGIRPFKENLHSTIVEYTESVAHDDYHRTKRAFENKEMKMAIEHFIEISRATFGYHWSKDMWLLRDFDFNNISASSLIYKHPIIKWFNKPAYQTSQFSTLLNSPYLANQLDNCSDSLKIRLTGSPRMFDKKGYPNQILLLLAIDLTINPDAWEQYGIVANPTYFAHPLKNVIKLAHFLNQHHVFSKEDMKGNIIRFNKFIRAEFRSGLLSPTMKFSLPVNPEQCTSLSIAKKISTVEISHHQKYRNNKIVFLGFMLPKEIADAKKPEISRDIFGNIFNFMRPRHQ